MRKIIPLIFIIFSSGTSDPLATGVGVGARAYGMANNFTALSNDFSSLYWNPAGMAFVVTREAHFAMDWNRQNMDGILSGDTSGAISRRLRVSSGGLMRSLPTTRGGYAFALGFLNPWLLDDISVLSGRDVYRGDKGIIGFADTLWPGDTLLQTRDNLISKGSFYLWCMGMGWQIAPSLGFGFSLGLLMGDEKRTNEFTSYYKQRAFEDISVFMDRTYFGYDARIGLMYKPHPMVSLGCRVEIPRYAKVAEHYQEVNYLALQESYDQSNFGTLKSSLAGSLGLALLLPYATISIDASGREPIEGAREKSDGSYWKGGGGIGFEAPLPWIASLVRCGYSYSQLDLIPVIIVWDDPGADTKETVTEFHGRHLLTAGYSLLTSGGVSLEASYGYQFWNFTTGSPDWEADAKEIHAQHRLMISASIRY